jgi:hypothetical protein
MSDFRARLTNVHPPKSTVDILWKRHELGVLGERRISRETPAATRSIEYSIQD